MSPSLTTHSSQSYLCYLRLLSDGSNGHSSSVVLKHFLHTFMGLPVSSYHHHHRHYLPCLLFQGQGSDLSSWVSCIPADCLLRVTIFFFTSRPRPLDQGSFSSFRNSRAASINWNSFLSNYMIYLTEGTLCEQCTIHDEPE